MPFPNTNTQFKTGLQQVPIAQKGGQSKSPKKRLAAYIRWLRKDGIKKESLQKINMLLDSREFSALDTYIYIHRLEELSEKDPKLLPTVIDCKIKWHKMVHGDYNTAVFINNQQAEEKITEVRFNIIRPDGTVEELK